MDTHPDPTPRPRVSVVVPVFNEQDTLRGLADEILASAPRWRLGGQATDVEVIWVDDGSTDRSTAILQALSAEHDMMRAVVLRRNFGKSAALSAGFDAAQGDVVVMLDADGQDDPRQVQKLLVRLDTGADLVGGYRRSRRDRAIKRHASSIYNRVTRRLTGLDLRDFNTGMKAMRTETARSLRLYGELHRFIPVLAAHDGWRVDEVEVAHRERMGGVTKYTGVGRYLRTILDLTTVLFLTRFGQRPLYLFGGIGATLMTTGLGMLTYLAGLKIFTGAGIGGRPLLDLGLLLTLIGVQIISVGLIGDVVRHNSRAQSATYHVRRTFGVGTPRVEVPDNVVDLRGTQLTQDTPSTPGN